MSFGGRRCQNHCRVSLVWSERVRLWWPVCVGWWRWRQTAAGVGGDEVVMRQGLPVCDCHSSLTVG